MKRRKRKAYRIANYLTIAMVILILLSVVSFLCLKSSGLYVNNKKIQDAIYSGLRVAFGFDGSIKVGSEVINSILEPSVMLMISIALVIEGAIFGMFNKKVLSFISAVMMLGAGIIFLCSGFLTFPSDEFKEIYAGANGINSISFKPMLGAYLSSILSFLGGGAMICKGLLIK